MHRYVIQLLVLSLALAGCGGGGSGSGSGGSRSIAPVSSAKTDLMNPENWEVGPIINGQNYSVGAPLHPKTHPDGWAIDIPTPGNVNYITARYGSLSGKHWLRLKLRIETDEGVEIVPKDSPGSPAMITLFFQRSGDDWSGTGKFETYRWWATFATLTPLRAGSFEIIAPLDQIWTAVQTSSALTKPDAFIDAQLQGDRVGFTFGGGSGYGHGVGATGPARVVVTTFEVE